MAITDTTAILRAHLITVSALTAVVPAARIQTPSLMENTELPALGFFVRGGISNPHIPPLPAPSVQFDCWGSTPIEARSVYNVLYDALQGLQGQSVTYPAGGSDVYRIASAVEETTGQDLQDVDIPTYYRVLTFFRIDIQAEPN